MRGRGAWSWQSSRNVCTECGGDFGEHGWGGKPVTCSERCARSRKTRLQKERRGKMSAPRGRIVPHEVSR